jgi:HlyD family secretion protein
MPRKLVVPVVVLLIAGAAGAWYLRTPHASVYYTGFVEGEERVIRSEVTGRVTAVRFAEGVRVPPNEVIAVLDDQDIQMRLKTKRQELAVIDADVQLQEEQIQLVDATWQRDLGARQAALREAQASATLAERTFAREHELVQTGVSSAQSLDDTRARRDQTRSAVDGAHEMVGRTEAEERKITLARQELVSLHARRDLAVAQLAELEVIASKYSIRAPTVPTSVQTQFLWPGELAQPGTAIVSVLDPADKYVQIYVPVSDVGLLHLGQRVAIDLDSRPGRRVPGEISFIADRATFTPEKIETRSDRMGQVYRAKVRILEDVESFQPGTEGNVYVGS